MVALLVFILAYNGDLAGKKNNDGRGLFGGNVFKAPTETRNRVWKASSTQGRAFPSFGNVLIREPKQAITQSRCKFWVTWRKACYHEIHVWQSWVVKPQVTQARKCEHRRASALLRNTRNIRICMWKKPVASLTYENKRISVKTAYLT